MLLTFSDVADRNFFEKRKNTALIICITLLFFGMCFAGWENWNERYANSAATYWSALFLLALIVGLNFGVLALRLFENNFKWHSNDIWVASIFIFLFLFFSGSLGTAEGIRDAHPEQSELDIVENINGDVLRLLLQKNGLIYAAELRVKENPKITILNHDEIRYISKIAKKTKGQKDDPSTQKK